MLAVAIAALAACVAFGQWYTARQKLVIDLFDKRYGAYKLLRSMAGEIQVNGNTIQTRFAFSAASFEMEYLFGDDVVAHLQQMREALLEWGRANRKSEAAEKRGLSDGPSIDAALTAEETFDRLSKDLYGLLMPYLRMKQKLPQPPSQWPSAVKASLTRLWNDRPDGR